MPEAARIGDTTLHDGTVTTGCDSVEIGNSPAARFLDEHCCEMTDPDGRAHVGGDIVQGSESVIIGNKPAARLGDECICYGPPVTTDVPAPSTASSAESTDEITTEVELSDDSGTENESHVTVSPDSIEAEGHASTRAYSRRILARLRRGASEIFGVHAGVDAGTAEAHGRVRGRAALAWDAVSGEGSAAARSGAVRGGFHVGDRDNPYWAEDAEVAGPGASANRIVRRENGVGEEVSAGYEWGSFNRRTRLTTPTVRGQNVQLATEGNLALSAGGTLRAHVYEQDGRTHVVAGGDTGALLAIVSFGLSTLLPTPSVGGGFDINWGRPFGPAGDTGGSPPTLPPFGAGPNEITSGEDTVLIGD